MSRIAEEPSLTLDVLRRSLRLYFNRRSRSPCLRNAVQVILIQEIRELIHLFFHLIATLRKSVKECQQPDENKEKRRD